MKFPWKRGGGADDEDQVSKLLYIIKKYLFFAVFQRKSVCIARPKGYLVILQKFP